LGWILYTQREDSYHPDEPYQYLSGDYFPVDEEIWLAKEDVANGYDTVVEDALNWINNLSYSYYAQLDKTFTQNLIQLTADVKNPNNHSLSVKANILTEGVLIDSLECIILNNQISETWEVLANEEHFYSLTINTKDEITSTTHTLPDIVRFTDVGPVVLDSVSISKVSDYYNVKPFVKNLSTVTTITNASIKLICDDPWITTILPASRPLPNIPPGAIVSTSSGFTVRVDSTFTNSLNFKVEISSANWPYWVDSMQVVVGVEKEKSLPTEYALEQNYPNPFNPTTNFRYSIPQTSKVVIKVFDVLGNEITTLMDEEKSIGTYELVWYAKNLPSGVYFYQLRAGSFIETKKMILLR
jgi:ribosomal protein L31